MFVRPVFDYFGFHKVGEFIDNSITILFNWFDTIIKGLVYFLGEFIGFVLLILYLYGMIRLNEQFLQLNMLLYYVGCIVFYQFVLNKYILCNLLLRFFDNYQYRDKDLKFNIQLHTNSNYLSLVFITLYAYLTGNSNTDLVYAITIVFLLDTYLGNRKRIKSA